MLQKKEDRVSLTVQDDGIGLPKEFDVDQSSGFGLTLIKMFTENLDGKFLMEDDYGVKAIVIFNVSE